MGFKQEYALFKQAQELARKFHRKGEILDIQFGLKKTDASLTNDLSIRFHVKKKKAKHQLKKAELLPKKIGKFKTDVIDYKIKPQTRIVEPFEETRPVFGGIEVQSCLFNQRIEWGTLGYCFTLQNIPFAITNFHVIFGGLDETQASTHINRLKLFQPNKPNFGSEIGLVTGPFNQSLDYCLIRLADKPDQAQSINKVNGIVNGFSQPVMGQRMAKVGAATKLTMGVLEARSLLDASKIVISYSHDPLNDSPKISDNGDSGSVWFVHDPHQPSVLKLVALHYGGDRPKNIAFATLFSSIFPSVRNKLNQNI